jgi:hypothetical protein
MKIILKKEAHSSAALKMSQKLVTDRLSNQSNTVCCLRKRIVWRKPNAMPQLGKDKFTQDWEPIYFFTRSPDSYYFNTQYEHPQK